jgi:UDP-GlcNAc3NAcA epimerase
MKVLTIVGARPQFIKAAVVSKAFAYYDSIKEVIVHTGQHFDANMSEVFFEQLSIPKPDYSLDIHGVGHGEMTGRMLIEIEKIILHEKPSYVVVYGDTNSTLAGALAAIKLHVPIVHIEAGLRSFNMKMPEEVNRILTDQVSSILFCPTQSAIENLAIEGFQSKTVEIENVGDVMQDSTIMFSKLATRPNITNLEQSFVLATLHRAENTDDPKRLKGIVSALNTLHKDHYQVVLPLHPRTASVLDKLDLKLDVCTIPPQGYLEMLWLLENAGLVLTDSGGVQKEAFFFGKSCVTLRDQTEWVELIECGANVLVGADTSLILNTVLANFGELVGDPNMIYGGGTASHKIANYLANKQPQ